MQFRIGDMDRNGKKVVAIDVASGFYRTDDGMVRDPDGYEWYADEQTSLPEQEILRDERSGSTVVVRDFKIAMMPGQQVDPKEFLEFHRKTIEATMVETGWEYGDGKQPMIFGKGQDGFAHIYVKMKKKNWKNRENVYAGGKQGQKGKIKSKALEKAGAVDPHIYGEIEIDKVGADIIANRETHE